MYDFNLNIGTGVGDSKPFQEGISDVLKGMNPQTGDYHADIEAKKKVDSDIDDGMSGGLIKKGSTINKYGLDPIKATTDAIDKTLATQTVDNRSIIARARNSICQFPCYVVQTCPVNPAQTICGFFERVYATFVQTVIAQNPIITEDEANNMEFLKRFHTNFQESTEDFFKKYDRLINEFYEPIDDVDRMMCESIYSEYTLTPNISVRFAVIPTDHPDLIAECSRLCNEPLTGFSYLAEKSENSAKTQIRSTVLTDKDFQQMAIERLGSDLRRKIEDDHQADIDMAEGDYENDVEDVNNSAYEDDEKKSKLADAKSKFDHQVAEIKQAIDREYEDKVNSEIEKIKAEIRDTKDPTIHPSLKFDGYNYLRGDKTQEQSRSTKDEKGPDAPVLLKDSDIKKMNNMLPYSISATFHIKNSTDGSIREVHYVIGIKTSMHLIRTQDLADDLREIVTGKIKSLQKVRYKTGEISFAEYLFNKKQLKADAMKGISYNKRWLNTLKRLGDYEQQYGSFLKFPLKKITGGEVPIPNGTMILTQPDITSLTNQTGIDLSQVSNAKALCKNLFLIGLCIVDSSAGTMRVLFPDMHDDWDVQSLAAVDAELSKTDNSRIMNELNHLVNR